jgi:rhodanese-related sulfurtransferase
MTEEQFVAVVVEGQPVRPHYFEFDARRNRQVHALLEEHEPPPLLDLDAVLDRARRGAVLLDTREPADFAAGHLAGAVNVGMQGRFAEWAGDVLDPEREIVLVGDPDAAVEGRVRLARVGFDRVVGPLADPGAALAARPELAETSSRLTAAALARLTGDEPTLQVVDVRAPGETAAGTLPGAHRVPLPALVDRLGELDRGLPVVAYCASGYRSVIAASVLRRAGFGDVSDLQGGFGAWVAAGLPVDHPEATGAGRDERPASTTSEPEGSPA